jgi:hypothetical protein
MVPQFLHDTWTLGTDCACEWAQRRRAASGLDRGSNEGCEGGQEGEGMAGFDVS